MASNYKWWKKIYLSHKMGDMKEMRLTKSVREKLLIINEGISITTSHSSRNFSFDRVYTILKGKLWIEELKKTSWADSRTCSKWIASDKEVHEFFYKNLWRLNTGELE